MNLEFHRHLWPPITVHAKNSKVDWHQLNSIRHQPPLDICMMSGFEISLIRSSETSINDSRTSEIPAGLVRRTTAYFWFLHKLHWLYIFQTSEWYIFTIHLPNGQVHSIWNFEAWMLRVFCEHDIVCAASSTQLKSLRYPILLSTDFARSYN